MKKSVLRITSLIIMSLSSMAYAFAHDFEVNGIYYTKMSATEVKVTYRGSSYSSYSKEYTGEVVIPAKVSYGSTVYSVTSIGSYAFRDCNTLTSVELPNSIAYIGIGAFYNCSKLASIVIPNSVTSIDVNAFYGCSSLTSVEIPNSVTCIGSFAFDDCGSLTSLTFNAENCEEYGSSRYPAFPATISNLKIGNKVTKIPDYFLGDGSMIEKLEIPNSVTYIGSSAFEDCSSLTSLTFNAENCEECGSSRYPAFPATISNLKIGDKVTNIPDYFLGNGSNIEKLEIPSSVTSIGRDAFYHCTSLTSVEIPNSVTSIGAYAFAYCSSLTSVEIPNSVTSISGAFSGCSSLTSIEIPNSVTSIGNSTFFGCSSLRSINIPSSVNSIGSSVFYGCSNLTSVKLPNSITSIESSVFSGCSNLASVEISNAATSIGDNAFYGCSNLASVEIPNSVTSIGKAAFSGCSNLASVEVSSSTTSIGDNAFYGCSNLASVEIPNSVTSIGSSAFEDCGSLTSLTFNAKNCSTCGSSKYPAFPATISNLTIGDNVTRIPANLLYNGSNIENLEIPNSVTSIGDYAFRNNKCLTSVEIPNSVTSIGVSAFDGCSSLTSLEFNAEYCSTCGSSNYPAFPATISNLTIGNKVTKIPANMLYSGSRVEYLELPNSVTSIGDYAFRNNSRLTSVIISGSVTSVGSNAFSGCTGLVKSAYPSTISNPFSKGISIKYPANGAIIEDGIVWGSDKSAIYFAPVNIANDFEIPNTVTSIGSDSFNGCRSLASVDIPNSVTYIGGSAFEGCSSLTSLIFNAENCSTCGSSSYPAFPATISDLTIGDKVTKIPANLLYNGSGIENLEIPNSVTTIGSNAFYGNTSLKSLVLGSGLVTIGSDAFSKCSIKKAFWLGNTPPSGVDNVRAFLNYVSSEGYSFSNQLVYQFLSSKFEVDGNIYIPVSASDRTCDLVDCRYSSDYKDVVIADKVTNRGIAFDILNVNDYAFYGNMHLETLSISHKGNIGSWTFDECKTLQEARIANNGYIGSGAFYSCNNLNKLNLGENITEIGYYAFEYCSSVKDVAIPNTVTTLGSSAFSGCSSLENVTIGSGVTSLPQRVFEYCSSLKAIAIPDNVSSIGDYAFSGCSSLTSLTIEDAATRSSGSLTLGSNGSKPLFSGCPLIEVYIGRKLTYNSEAERGYSPFYRNGYLTSVEISDAETQIYDNEFYGCTNLQSLKIGDGVTAIGSYAFSGCSSLSYFSAGYNVKSIGAEAFSDCTGLTRYYSYSIEPPVCGTQALDDINKWDCTLYVPAESSDEYAAAEQWKEFFFVNEMDAVLVAEILISAESVAIKPGNSAQLTATVLPGNATNPALTWSSSDESVATVDANGLVTAVALGEAVITVASAEDSSVYAECVVTVSENAEENSIAEVSAAAGVREVIYDLQGRCVSNPGRGIYIINGRKVFRR